jgi:hypothetical protein
MNLSAAQFSDPALPLAVVVAQTRWDEPPRMRHQVTRQLMRRFNVLFVEFFPMTRAQDEMRAIEDRLLVCTLRAGAIQMPRWYGNDPLRHWWVNRQYAKQIERVVGSLPGRPKLLFNFAYDFPEIMGASLYELKLYVCNDEFPRMWRRATRPNAIKYFYQSRLHQHYENQVARQADRCLATHTPLVEKLSGVNDKTTLFLHGHESVVRRNSTSVRGAASKIRVAYMGYITYSLMPDWLQAVLTTTDIDLFLIGPVGKFDINRFSGHVNLHHVKPLKGAALQAALADMDVLVMPYNPAIPEVHVLTASNKFFQYVAAGRPIVISDMPHYINMPSGVIYRARTVEEFVAQIRRAHAEDCGEYRELRAQIARENTWDKRGDELFSMIDDDLNGRLSNAVHLASAGSHGTVENGSKGTGS